MRFYVADGLYFPTQALAAKQNKNFSPVDVPVSHHELAEYLNNIATPVEIVRDAANGHGPDVIEAWTDLPLSTQLLLAMGAVERAQHALAMAEVSREATRYAIAREDMLHDANDVL